MAFAKKKKYSPEPFNQEAAVEENGYTEAFEPVSEPVAEPVAEAQVEETPAVEETAVAEEAPVEAVEEAVDEVEEEFDENSVTFSKSARETLEEKYLALSTEAKNWYDEIVRYAMLQKGVKRFKTAKQEVYKVGKHRIVKLSIRRGVIISEFLILNLSLPTGDGVSLKQAPTILKVDSDDALTVAIRTIDLAIAAAEEDRRIKREQKNERRRQARAAEAAE